MLIRTAELSDLDAIAAVEAECFSAAEAAGKEDLRSRLEVYPNHFLLMFGSGGELISFVDGFVTDEPDLTDEMYEKAEMHNENGKWQMIFGVNTMPQFRRNGHAKKLLDEFILTAKQQGRLGVVLTCRARLIHYYERFGFVDEGVTVKSVHGGAQWHQMRLVFSKQKEEV